MIAKRTERSHRKDIKRKQEEMSSCKKIKCMVVRKKNPDQVTRMSRKYRNSALVTNNGKTCLPETK